MCEVSNPIYPSNHRPPSPLKYHHQASHTTIKKFQSSAHLSLHPIRPLHSTTPSHRQTPTLLHSPSTHARPPARQHTNPPISLLYISIPTQNSIPDAPTPAPRFTIPLPRHSRASGLPWLMLQPDPAPPSHKLGTTTGVCRGDLWVCAPSRGSVI